ncbi:MAG: class I SAM-dependent methyltransferase [Candidatus Krumholzibacteria bacterium]|jgi:SAM-dependent methyltransferase|nr:class I SAM-dependent methyltransferase [Candidatus Krumholzibacteria bacterium]
MSKLPTTREIAAAIVFAAEQNPQTLDCERRFARKIEAAPSVVAARLGRIRYMCGLLGIKPGDVILDVGAGIGLNSILALLCGASTVRAVEYEGSRFASARLICQHLKIEDRIELHQADILELALEPGSIDAAFSFELLEHIRDTQRLYANLARWLRPGGRVYGRTGANGRNLYYRRRYRKEWDRIDAASFQPIRAQLIQEIVPGIAPGVLRELVARTRGELFAAVQNAALEYRRNGILPPAKPPCPPRDPHSGEYMERLLDPATTIAIMDAQGFETSLLRPDFANMTIVNPARAMVLKFAGRVIGATHPASLAVAPWLEFLSTRAQRTEPAATPLLAATAD